MFCLFVCFLENLLKKGRQSKEEESEGKNLHYVADFQGELLVNEEVEHEKLMFSCQFFFERISILNKRIFSTLPQN